MSKVSTVIDRTFHLGKKAYSYRLKGERDVILFGNSKWNSEEKACELTFFYITIDAGAPFELIGIPDGSKVLGVYKARSEKFKTGEFSDFDSQRYLKSRYREIFRTANRQRTGESVLQALETFNMEYLKETRSNAKNTTSAQEAKKKEEIKEVSLAELLVNE